MWVGCGFLERKVTACSASVRLLPPAGNGGKRFPSPGDVTRLAFGIQDAVGPGGPAGERHRWNGARPTASAALEHAARSTPCSGSTRRAATPHTSRDSRERDPILGVEKRLSSPEISCVCGSASGQTRNSFICKTLLTSINCTGFRMNVTQ